jgi:23S rRNA pseudouridine1911/1915/1917 synthase
MEKLPLPPVETQLLAWLFLALAPMNRTRVKEVLRSGRIHVNGTSVTRHDHPLHPGDALTLAPHVPFQERERIPIIPVVYEDPHLIVIDKPAGLLTVATESEKTDTAFVRLSESLTARKAGRPFVVHRLDRDTSGLLLFARSAEVRDALQANWESVTKTYLAVVEGAPAPSDGVIENYLTEGRDLRVRASAHAKKDAKRAVSRYKVRASRGGYSLVEVELETGRKHQIRVHMAGLGCPIAGDAVYGAATNPAKRLCLHAWRVGLDHPVTAARVEVESPLPSALARFG